ncbi:hypothetical protein [Stenotrophomonas indicatrix]|uniref:hypothetical protein n=1 Tax=Stenotrophomonas indicatrix TaxID=2045451 RepID=UPI0008BD75EA|nr:hypothetical protein [Stenotrophomonas indicatrix]SET91338.1 hypothetical protein SAMN05720615_109212 [Stenotrophomonas indicatrix]SEU12747.1 hypothetical protein SAMN05720615_11836 [Stenotrophomonas indicatrix]
MAEFKHAKYLYKDGEVKLFAGDEVEDALADGWEYPKFPRSNGEEWNPEVPADEVSAADAAAEVQKANRARQEKLDAREAKADAKPAGKK